MPPIDTKAKFYIKVQKDKRESLGYYPEKITFILDEVGTNKQVLDIGCNDGFIGEMLIKRNNKVVGIDVVKKNLEIARRKGLCVKLIDVEKERFPFHKDYFDIVILGDILEHIFDTDRLIEECKRVLRIGGKLIVTTPNVASIGRRILLLFGKNPFLEYSLYLSTNGLPSVGHIRYYTEETLRIQLSHHGFRIIRMKGNVLNLLFFTTHFLTEQKPSFCMMLMCAAVKEDV